MEEVISLASEWQVVEITYVTLFFAIFNNKERKELKVFIYTRNYKKRLRHHVGVCLGTRGAPNILIFFTVKQKECFGLKLESEG